MCHSTILGDADKFFESVNKKMVYPSDEHNKFLLTTGNIDWSSQPDIGVWYEREVFIAPGEAPQIKYRKLPNQNNSAMIHADIYGDAERRFRPCQNCHEDFKYKSEDDWLCAPCKGLRAEMERRQGVEGDLLNANGKFK